METELKSFAIYVEYLISEEMYTICTAVQNRFKDILFSGSNDIRMKK